jgi:hypothetical protein
MLIKRWRKPDLQKVPGKPNKEFQKGDPMTTNDLEPKTETLAETENYLAWKAMEPDGETTYHLELNNVTMHFFKEEWDEFIELVRSLK